ncbi:MAG: HepT-like ribonuclease domain-containing protein [Anaerolineae bacterium]
MLASDAIRLRHMLDAARKAVTFASKRASADLEEEEMLALALVRLIEVVGEAAKSVSAATRALHPDLPWREMAGARDRLIHGYDDVDLDQVRVIVDQDLPTLIAQLEAILPPEP